MQRIGLFLGASAGLAVLLCGAFPASAQTPAFLRGVPRRQRTPPHGVDGPVFTREQTSLAAAPTMLTYNRSPSMGESMSTA
jgi:hypothetical protein